jgi:hypothetical protein
MDWSRPTPENAVALAAVHDRLRAAGTPEGARGYDLVALQIAVTLLGWMADVGPAMPDDPAPCMGSVALPFATTTYIGWGWDEAVALARALDRALTDLDEGLSGP